MMKYKISLNQGNAALGSGKSITVNEELETVGEKTLAREIVHHNPLIPQQVCEDVLENFCKAACELMAQGYAIVLKSDGDAAIRIYGDIHVKGGSINLERARQLDPTVTDLTVENAMELVQKAGGVTVRARAEVEQKLTDMLLAESEGVTCKGVVERAYVERAEGGQSAGGDANQGGSDNQGNDNGQGGNTGGDGGSGSGDIEG